MIEEVICVFGSRRKWWSNPAAVHLFTEHIVLSLPKHVIVLTGGADGVDSWAWSAATMHGYRTRVDHANWTDEDGEFDPKGGFKRNARLAYDCTGALGIWDGQSPGTQSMQNFLDSMLKPYDMFYPER